jgi:hypothetical protein
MSRKRTVLLAAGLFLGMLVTTPALQGQRRGFEAGGGLHQPRMDDLTYLLEYIHEAYPVEAKILASFPPYTSASAGLRFTPYPSLEVGGGYSFSTSGARINYTDYSGSLSTDMSAASHRLGLLASYALLGDRRVVLRAFGKVELNYSTTRITSSWIFSTFSDIDAFEYYSVSPSLSGGLELFYHFETISLGLEGSYMADMPATLKERESRDPLTDPGDPERELTTDWTGWRAQLKIIFWL